MMQNIFNLHQRGALTEQQVLHAHKFANNPNSYTLAPTFYRVLHDLVLQDEPLESYEKRKGFPARSAKAILGMILHAMQEMQGSHSELSEEERANEVSAQEQLKYLTADNFADIAPHVQKWGLTRQEARLLLILERSKDRIASKEALLNRLYVETPNDLPDVKIIDVFICKLRKKLATSEYRIDTVWGVGYKLIRTDFPLSKKEKKPKPETEDAQAQRQAQALLWYKMNVYDQVSMREIARQFDVYPSTVMRNIHWICDEFEDDQLELFVKELEADDKKPPGDASENDQRLSA
jgi:DNA-binding winged helix-turn-helix (wHTH) protein